MKKTILTLTTISLLFAGCEKTDEPEKTKVTLNKSSLTIHYDESSALTATVTPTPLDVLWLTSDETIATVTQNGNVAGVKIGEATITAKTLEGEGVCEVTIEPYFNLYTEPVLEFGQTVAYIKGKETRPLMAEVTNESLKYSDANNLVDYLLYSFENGKLDGCGVLFTTDFLELSTDDIVTFYGERYDYLGSSEDYIYYGNDDVLLGITQIGMSLAALYVKKTTTKSTYKFSSILDALIPDKKVDNHRPQIWFESLKQTK